MFRSPVGLKAMSRQRWYVASAPSIAIMFSISIWYQSTVSLPVLEDVHGDADRPRVGLLLAQVRVAERVRDADAAGRGLLRERRDCRSTERTRRAHQRPADRERLMRPARWRIGRDAGVALNAPGAERFCEHQSRVAPPPPNTCVRAM